MADGESHPSPSSSAQSFTKSTAPLKIKTVFPLTTDESENSGKIAPEIETVRLLSNPPDKPPERVVEIPPQLPTDERLPVIRNIRWEIKKAAGVVECWYAPLGARTHRKDTVYLGRIGKRLQSKWDSLTEADFTATITRWVTDRKIEKGISD